MMVQLDSNRSLTCAHVCARDGAWRRGGSGAERGAMCVGGGKDLGKCVCCVVSVSVCVAALPLSLTVYYR